MRYGVCADPKFGPALAQAGFDFIELNVQQHLMPLANDTTAEPELARIGRRPASYCNSFVPGSLKITDQWLTEQPSKRMRIQRLPVHRPWGSARSSSGQAEHARYPMDLTVTRRGSNSSGSALWSGLGLKRTT